MDEARSSQRSSPVDTCSARRMCGTGFAEHYVVAAVCAGRLRLRLSRSTDDEGFDAVAAVLAGGREDLRTLHLRPGDPQIFRGRHSLHRVTRVGAQSRPRHAAIFAYTLEPRGDRPGGANPPALRPGSPRPRGGRVPEGPAPTPCSTDRSGSTRPGLGLWRESFHVRVGAGALHPHERDLRRCERGVELRRFVGWPLAGGAARA